MKEVPGPLLGYFLAIKAWAGVMNNAFMELTGMEFTVIFGKHK